VPNCLSSWEVHGNQPDEVFRGTEWYPAYAPWRSEEHLNAYDEIRIKTNNGEISGESLQEAVPALPRVHSSDPEGVPVRLWSEVFGTGSIGDKD
jgi:hypothetical protein